MPTSLPAEHCADRAVEVQQHVATLREELGQCHRGKGRATLPHRLSDRYAADAFHLIRAGLATGPTR
jgi:hypothetical protein